MKHTYPPRANEAFIKRDIFYTLLYIINCIYIIIYKKNRYASTMHLPSVAIIEGESPSILIIIITALLFQKVVQWSNYLVLENMALGR